MRISKLGAVIIVLAAALPALAQTAGNPNTGSTSDTGARPGNEIGTGNSLPRSDKASNINSADSPTRIAPNLPAPPLADNAGAREYLIAARNALAAGKTGMAQQSLEMAQTRLLDRSVAPSQVNDASRDPRVKHIEDARQALGHGDSASAMRIIDSALTP